MAALGYTWLLWSVGPERDSQGANIKTVLQAKYPGGDLDKFYVYDATNGTLFKTGHIGVYKGASVVQIENFENFYGDRVLNDNEILIIGQNAGRLTYYGNTPKTQVLAQQAFYQRWETARDAGMSLFGAESGRIGRIILT